MHISVLGGVADVLMLSLSLLHFALNEELLRTIIVLDSILLCPATADCKLPKMSYLKNAIKDDKDCLIEFALPSKKLNPF